MSWPGESHGPLQFVGPKSKAYSSDTKATITGKKVDHGANYKIHVSGSDPLIIGAPDADVHADVTITRHLSGLVKIEVSVRGDQFPAYEMVIRDRKNNSIFLSGFMPVSGGDATKLIGDSQELLGKLTITATLDKNGNFDRILSANFKGPYAEIGNDRDPNSSFTLTGWSRALMTVLTPDNMPEPKHLPEPAQKPHQSKSPDIARSKGGMER
jgi:hypothetical protein